MCVCVCVCMCVCVRVCMCVCCEGDIYKTEIQRELKRKRENDQVLKYSAALSVAFIYLKFLRRLSEKWDSYKNKDHKSSHLSSSASTQ